MDFKKYIGYQGLRIPFKFSRGWTILRIIVEIVLRLLVPFQMYIVAVLIDSLNNRDNIENINIALGLLFVCLGSIFMIRQCIQSTLFAIDCKIENDLRIKYKKMILEKCAKLKYENIENKSIQNLLHRIIYNIESEILEGINAYERILGIGLQLLAILVTFSFKVWWVSLGIFLLSLPIIIVSIKSGIANYQMTKKMTLKERECEYLNSILINQDAAVERTIFGFTSQIGSRWRKAFGLSKSEKLKTEKKWMFNSKLSGLFVVLLLVFMCIGMILPLSKGSITSGLYIASILTMGSLMTTLTWELSQNVDQYIRFLEFYKELEEYEALSVEEDNCLNYIKSKQPEKFESLQFSNVSFSYPGCSKKILHNLSFRIEAGKCVALVGLNGEGKTTIIKLILKMYENYEGRIFINDISIRDISYDTIRRLVSVLFQDFGRYYLSIKDNIIMGREYNLNNVQKTYKNLLIDSIFEDANMKLGKTDKDGSELSGGQWQLIAMLRTLIADTPVCILDEPTAAIDPIREVELYKQFREISKHKTVLLITHRLASVKIADEIVVLSQGKIEEKGNHSMLINKKGLYSEMYDKQRRWYEK